MDGKVYALNASNGALIWSYNVGYRIAWSSPAVAYGKVYIGSNDRKVYALDAFDGDLVWSYTTGYWVDSSPAVAYGKVYIGSRDNKIYCLDASTGAFVWSYATGAVMWSSPAVADGKVYVGAGYGNGKIYSLDAFTGAVVWSYATDGIIYSSPGIADGKVYVGSRDNKIYAFGPPPMPTLTITTTTGGTTTPAPSRHSYVNGTIVSVTAVPSVHCSFDHWELDGANAGSVNPISVTMDKDHALHAIFLTPWQDWAHYHNYTEIVNTLLYLNTTYLSIVDVFSIGKSWQNKDIYCIKLTNESNMHPKPKLLFVGYHHARELISAELPLYFAVEAATNFGTNKTITHMLNYSEIYIIPALNVDAFDAVKQNEWQRKNVHPFDEDGDGLMDEDPPDDEDGDGYIEDLFYWDGYTYYFIRWEGIDDDGDGLYNEDWVGGVDLNRNYGYQWDAQCQSGSLYPWDEDYRGPAPFSEPETQAIRDLALSHNFKYAISFHSGAECVVYPWGYTTEDPPDKEKFEEIASEIAQLTSIWYSQSGDWYTTSGVWDDWMYGNRSTFAVTCEIYTN